MKSRGKSKINFLDKAAREQFKYFNTKGFKKLWNYFLDIAKSDHFLLTINSLRIRHEIPKEGFNPNILSITDNNRFIWPPEWKYYKNKERWNEISKEIEILSKKYHLHYMDWWEIIARYLFYNILEVSFYSNSYNLCRVANLIEEKEEPLEGFTESDDIAYPIAIRISPYASQRDIVDFVKKSYRQIEVYQKYYRLKEIKIGRVKSKNPSIKERNEFIFKHRFLPVKEIRARLAKNDIFLDDGHITKIISLERKKRKDL